MRSLESTARRLLRLQERQRELAEELAQTRRQLRDASRVRAGIRARVVGETLLELQEGGWLPEELQRQFKEKLLACVEGKNQEFEALQGSAFDLTQLLLEGSEPSEVAR
jgi:hypothetical protein